MKRISDTIKESIVKQSIGQKGIILQAIAKQNNVGYSSIKKWIQEYQSSPLNRPNSIHQTFSRADRLKHILATASLDEQALGVYCRERGLYAIQLNEWKNAMTKETDEQKPQELLNELKRLRLENKELKQDLHRKDRALAETTALLVLKKKAAAIWGEHEGD